MLQKKNEKALAERKIARRKTTKIGRERPHFLGFQPPKKFFGVAPALGTPSRAAFVFRRYRDHRVRIKKKEKQMPIIKKAPAILKREFRLEEPVSALLDDYAQFIESSADHVLNSAIKKTLWRDQDYRKWRESKDAVTALPKPAEERSRRRRHDAPRS